MLFYWVPGCGSDVWAMDCNFAKYLDGLVLVGHTWSTPSQNDPDGILSVLSSTTSVLFGMLAGQLILQNASAKRRTPTLLAVGIALVLSGELLARWIPISKILWTPSYVVLMAGLSSIAFGVCYWMVEERHQARWLWPLETFGLNAIVAYVVSRVGSNPLKVHVMGRSVHGLLLAVARPVNASLLFALVNVLLVFGFILWMRHRRIFVKF